MLIHSDVIVHCTTLSIYKYCRYVKISRKCHPQKIRYVYIACNAIYFTESEYHYPYQNKQKHYIRRSKPQQLKVHEYYAPQEIHYQLNPVYRQQFSFHTHRRITVMYQMRRSPITAYSITHTTGNTHDGGINGGLLYFWKNSLKLPASSPDDIPMTSADSI